MAITYDDLTKVTLDFYLCSPERAGEMLLLAFESGDADIFANLLSELSSRGTDAADAMALLSEARERHEKFWNWFADPKCKISGGKELKSPLQFAARKTK